MSLKQLEQLQISHVPLIDYWVKLGPYILFSIFLHACGGLAAWIFGATFWGWQIFMLIMAILGTILIAGRGWQLQTPLEIRPAFVLWFTSIYHFWTAFLIVLVQAIINFSFWSFAWIFVWIIFVLIINWLLVFVINKMYARAKFYRS